MNYTRRDFLRIGGGIIGSGLLTKSCAYNTKVETVEGIKKKNVLLLSDIHVGYFDDQKDGDGWLTLALYDVRENIPDINYAFVLGDIAQSGKEEEFKKYLLLRDNSSISEWYELAGNHDNRNNGIENFVQLINQYRTYSVIDGNILWFLLSDEELSTKGNIGESTCKWIKKIISLNPDKNIIMCSHQLVHNTVRDSDVYDRYIHPKKLVKEILDTGRISLWLTGHQHAYFYTEKDICVKDGTWFINVSSLSHCYNTGESQSYLLELIDGAMEINAYRRLHDRYKFDDRFAFKIPVPFKIKTSEKCKIQL